MDQKPHTKTIYLIRHGESVDNAERRHQHAGTPLSKKGWKQTALIAQRVRRLPIDGILSSDYTRTRDTAKAISTAIGKPVGYVEILREIRKPSAVAKKLKSDPKAKAIMSEVRNHRNDADWHHSDEENFTDRKERAQRIISFLERAEGRHLLVVTHSGIIRSVVGVLLFGSTMTTKEYYRFLAFTNVDNTGITVCKHHPDHGWKLVTLNDLAHFGE